ncbi:MAG: 5-(carboxyamino)imidazole ribonucleotide synthase [Oscillospiraceae bacterium]|jgi:5-(carboxyamino)imidazole ribonucleotide synthase|nr:5-(carboxyamino)imidazole ribonucleotide synthase [Oscillospiraceae bacterium]
MNTYCNKKIGIIGGGQLGKMMILEAKRLGFYVAVLDPTLNCPASSICDLHIVSDFNDAEGYKKLAKHVDVITYEFEHINATILEELEQKGHKIYPSVKTLKKIQNKYVQKSELKAVGLPVPRFEKVSNEKDIENWIKDNELKYPLMLKTTTSGYDGKGNAVINSAKDIEVAYKKLGSGKTELMLEEFVLLDKEVSIIICTTINGDREIYPVAENTHVNSILDTTITPARITEAVNEEILSIIDKVMQVFESVGTFCIELFIAKNGEVYVNEVAPRPHNSGHYTIEVCFANQFENHIRAIVGLPLGCTKQTKPAVMVNLLGESDGTAKLIGLEEAYKDKNVHVHYYGKAISKIDRKMAHYTVVADTIDEAIKGAEKLKKILRVVGNV